MALKKDLSKTVTDATTEHFRVEELVAAVNDGVDDVSSVAAFLSSVVKSMNSGAMVNCAAY